MPYRTASLSMARAAALLAALSSLAFGGLLAGRRPPAARAGVSQVSIMMDDDRLLYRSDRTRVRTLLEMKKLGVQVIRVTMLWNVVAGTAHSTPAHRRRFRAQQPNTYPRGSWDRYDLLDREASGIGISVYFDVTGPGPSWTHAAPPANDRKDKRTWKPSSSEFYKFVLAAGRRYSGTSVDRQKQLIPRVTIWSLWNEPNQGGWLTPQWERHGSTLIAESPIIYRQLYLAGRRALDDSGHGTDIIMAGETAPLGSTRHDSRSAMFPAKFIRELMCVNDGGQPYTGGAAGARDCSAFDRLGPLRASAWAHHPYTKKVAPNVRDSHRDSITMANIGELPKLLDNLAAATGHIAPGLPIVSSEFGYETNPPDPFNGMPLSKQADWINIGDFLAFVNPRVVGQTQFQLFDAPPLRQYPATSKKHWFTYQAGLLFANGRPKPSLTTYELPFFAFPAKKDPATNYPRVGVWGQLRFHDGLISTRSPDQVQIEFRAAGSGAWQPLGPALAVTNREGFFFAALPVPGAGAVRAHWAQTGQADHISRAVPVAAGG
ncbi:MAG TPA: hypothetical protein VGY97_09280 [Solirubrobacteraceae bacterium]|nr:hypothetical protein [Solirubrobacteraceae bacterium]